MVEELLGRLRDLGLEPQVISGNVEARLTFYGVAHDFPGERIASRIRAAVRLSSWWARMCRVKGRALLPSIALNRST